MPASDSSDEADIESSTPQAKQFATESDVEQEPESDSDSSSDDAANSDAASDGVQLDDVPFSALAKANVKLKERSLKRKRRRQGNDEEEEDGQQGHSHFGSGSKGSLQYGGERKQTIASRPNKHAPQEMSSKRPVKRARTVIETPKIARRDPRFDDLSGSLNTDKFETSYAFLKKNKQAELAQLKSTFKKAKKSASISNADKEELQRKLTRLESSVATDKQKAQQAEAVHAWRKAEREKQGGGKKAFYLKDKQRKEIVEQDRIDKMDKRQLKRREQRQASRQLSKDKRDRPPQRLVGPSQ